MAPTNAVRKRPASALKQVENRNAASHASRSNGQSKRKEGRTPTTITATVAAQRLATSAARLLNAVDSKQKKTKPGHHVNGRNSNKSSKAAPAPKKNNDSSAPKKSKRDKDLYTLAEPGTFIPEPADGGQCTLLCTLDAAQPLRSISIPKARALIDGSTLPGGRGLTMPYVGFGTYKLKKGEAFAPVLKALQYGYRLVDTAQIYDNEADVGRAMQMCGVPRENLFVETKVWRSSHGFDRTLKAFGQSMRKLAVDYVDLYIIHWPGAKTGWPLPRGAISPPDWTPKMRDEGTWRAMEKLYDEGKVKAIGVSNYSIRHLRSLLKMCRVRPVVNQVEFHPWLVQSELLEFCKKENIILQAYASLGSGDVTSRADFFALPPVMAAAKAHERTPAQVLLRWALEKGVYVIPKSKSEDRIVENSCVFDFKLSPEEVAAIDSCHKDHRFAWKHKDPDTCE